MAVPPEVAFDRAIRNYYPEYRRCEYAGRFEVDPDRHPLLHDVYTLINGMYELHANRFVADDNRSPNLHFDFIEGSAVNALAFNDQHYSFVALTVALVRELEQIADELARSNRVWELFGHHSEINQESTQSLWTALVITVLQFVAFHELGHHMHGHCPRDGNLSLRVREEYDPVRAGRADVNELQADELDADEYAIRTISENLLAGPVRPEILDMLGRPTDEETDGNLLTLITLAVGTFFFHRTSTDGDLSKFAASSHPPMPARLQRAMEALRKWLVVNQPASEEWVLGEKYLHVMNVGTDILDREGRGVIWNSQTSLLDSLGGGAYLDSLDDFRQRRRNSLNAVRWKIKHL
jgi:hypothetical protein